MNMWTRTGDLPIRALSLAYLDAQELSAFGFSGHLIDLLAVQSATLFTNTTYILPLMQLGCLSRCGFCLS